MPRLRVLRHPLRNPVGGKYDGRVRRHVVEFVDKDGAARLELLDDEAVVNDFVAHVDGRAETVKRRLHDPDRSLHPGAKSTRACQQN